MLTQTSTCCSFIDGKHRQAGSNAPLVSKQHPANNENIYQIAYAEEADVQYAIETSQRAFNIWSQMSVAQRGNILLRAAEILRERLPELAEIEVWDTGKPITEALNVDVLSAADALEYFARAAVAVEGEVVPNSSALIYTVREPLGVCVGIGAWNYPLQIACWKAAPALMMGNTMIFKPSELTPATTLKLAEIFLHAGMPPGVFNVVTGNGAVAEKLLAQPNIAKISFTGSAATGKKILQQAATQLLPVTLELGGKSPLLVFEDADLEQAVLGSMLANFYTQGEICSNGTRVFVARKLHDQFIEKLTARTNKLVIGNPFDHATQVGALISREHLQKVQRYIAEGKLAGADLVCGGGQPAQFENGNFIEPTVFTHCDDTMSIVREEIFGPVMSVLTFDDEEEVVMRANQTRYGLAAGIFTENIKRGHRVAHQLQAGTCWVNNYNMTPPGMPFGGTKKSGFGRENALSTMLGYTQQKSIYVELKEIEHSYIG